MELSVTELMDRTTMLAPVFIEAWDGPREAQFQICRKIAAHLLKAGVTPLPFAASAKELASVLHALKDQNRKPALLIVNTFWAEEILKDLDAICGDVPILLLHRELMQPNTWVQDPIKGRTLLGLQDADARPIAIMGYGAKNCDSLALCISGLIADFLKEPRFSQFLKLDIRHKSN